MLKRSLVVLGVCSVAGALVGCGSDETTEANGNPTITELSADADAIVLTIGHAQITVAATDPDGDALSYSWSVNLGALDAADGPDPKTLTAPAERGTVTVTVQVSDGKGGSDEETLDVGVLGFVRPESANVIGEGIDFNAMGFVNADDGFITGGSETANVPTIFHYRSGVWTDETAGTSGHMTAGVAIASDNLWVAGGGGLGFHYDGTEWSQFTIPGGCVHGMYAVDANNIWVTPAEAQEVMRQYTGGLLNAWTSFDAENAIGMNGISFAGANDGFAVGSGGRAHHFDGTAWSEIDVGATATLKDVELISATDGWIAGEDGVVLHWDGTVWTAATTPAGARDVNGLFALATDDVWAVGSEGLIMHFDGSAWTEVPSGVTNTLTTVHFTSATDGWVTGLDSALLHLE